MTGETEREPSGWTTDTLKALEDEKITALRDLFQAEVKRLEAILAGQERAVTLLGNANQIAQNKFEDTVRDGFVKQNEFRGSLDDLGKTMATRRELEALLAQMSELRSRIDIGPPQLSDLQHWADRQAGHQTGTQQLTTNTYAALLVLVGIAAIVGHYIH